MKDVAAISAEQALVSRARMGDTDAFSQLSTRSRAQVFRVSLKLLKNREDAEDNVQNTMLRAYRFITRFNSSSKFSTWLVRIAINEALMLLRSKHSRNHKSILPSDDCEQAVALDVPDPKKDPEVQYRNKELVSRALEDLSPSLRNVFLLSKLEGWSNLELTEHLGLSAEQLKQSVFRARLAMRKALYRSSIQIRAAECRDSAT